MPAKYPHMMPFEVPIWERFLADVPFRAVKISYDVHLGKGIPVNPDWPAWLVSVVRATSRKRADVVLETANAVWVLEIKVRASFSALGQLMGYGVLLLEEWEPRKPVRLAVICERVAADMSPVLAEFGISVFVV